jgi:hypothetical protein
MIEPRPQASSRADRERGAARRRCARITTRSRGRGIWRRTGRGHRHRRAAITSGHRHRGQGEGGLRRRDPLLGRGHRRHPLRPLPRPGRAARHLRQARRLRGDPRAHPRDPRRLAAHPLGQGRSRGLEGQGRRGRARLRRDELEHLPGPAAAAAELQVRLAVPQRRRHAAAGGRAQPRMHRDRWGARVEGADGLDRRRVELSRPDRPHPPVRAVSGLAPRSTRGSPTTGGCSPSTRCTSPPSIRPWCRTGAPT